MTTTIKIQHKHGCSEPEPRIYPKAHRCPECHRSIDLDPKAPAPPKPHKTHCRRPRLTLFIGSRGDLCRWCLTCSGAFVVVAPTGTYDIDVAEQLLAAQDTRTELSA